MDTGIRSLVAFSLHGNWSKKAPLSGGGKEQGKFSVPIKEGKAKAAELFN
jgi:hypothetical protein